MEENQEEKVQENEKVVIPEVTMSEDKVILEIKEVPIRVNGEDKIVKMQAITAGKRRAIVKKHLNVQVRGKTLEGGVTDMLGVQTEILAEVIVEAPFPYDLKSLEGMPEDVIDYLYSQYEGDSKKKLKSED